jgi:hypothetical protein
MSETLPVTRGPVLVLGAGLFQVPLLERLSALGIPVVVVSPYAPRHSLSPVIRHEPADLTDYTALTSLALRHNAHIAISTASEIGARAAAHVNSQLGWGGHQAAYIDLGLDKQRLRERLAALNMPNLQHSILKSEADLSNFEKTVAASSVLWVIKPCGGWGSRGVFITRSAAERRSAFSSLASSRYGELGAIAEAYLAGPEFGGNGCFINGRLSWLAITEKSLYRDTFVRGHWHDSSQRYGFEGRLREVLTALGEDVGFSTGIVNFDVRCNSVEEPVLLDIGFRDGGNGLGMLLQPCSGKDSIDLLIAIAFNDISSIEVCASTSLAKGFSLICFHQEEVEKVMGMLHGKGVLFSSHAVVQNGDEAVGNTPVAYMVSHDARADLHAIYLEALELVSEKR